MLRIFYKTESIEDIFKINKVEYNEEMIYWLKEMLNIDVYEKSVRFNGFDIIYKKDSKTYLMIDIKRNNIYLSSEFICEEFIKKFNSSYSLFYYLCYYLLPSYNSIYVASFYSYYNFEHY